MATIKQLTAIKKKLKTLENTWPAGLRLAILDDTIALVAPDNQVIETYKIPSVGDGPGTRIKDGIEYVRAG